MRPDDKTDSYGTSGNIPSGTIGQNCYISGSTGEGQDCDALAAAISACQSAGVEIILSLGGASGSYSLQSDAQAQEIGQYLWDSYGESRASPPDPVDERELVDVEQPQLDVVCPLFLLLFLFFFCFSDDVRAGLAWRTQETLATRRSLDRSAMSL